MSKQKLTPAQELTQLCDFKVTQCIAHISEITPGAEWFSEGHAKTLIKFLQNTPDLTGIISDGLANIKFPGTLDDTFVFYNLSEEEVFKHLSKVPREEHVHWMFNHLMKIMDKWFATLRKAFPHIKIVYSADSDDFANNCERMLRVVVQSAKVKAKLSHKIYEDRKVFLQKTLDGFGQPKKSRLEAKIRELKQRENKFKKQGRKKEAKKLAVERADIESYLNLKERKRELTARLKVFKDAEDEKRVEQTEAELITVSSAINVKEKGLKSTLSTLHAQRETLKGVRGKQPERDALDKEIKKLGQEIAEIEEKIADVNQSLRGINKFLGNYRDPKTSPVYQQLVVKHVNKLYNRFNALGEKYDIQILTKPDVVVFGDMVVDYAHDDGRTWTPMPKKGKRLAESFHGLLESYQKNVAEILKEMGSNARRAHVILRSGNSGVFFARWQRMHLTDEEVAMQHVNTFYTGGSDGVDIVTFVSGSPFEDQEKISKHINRGKPGRWRADKLKGENAHPAFVRNQKRSVSGMTLIRMHNHELTSVEPILYKLFKNKAILEPFKGVASQDDSDNHFGSPEMDGLLTLGTLAMNKQLMKNPLELYGTKVYIGCIFNLGDTAEANSRAWKEGHKYRREVMASIKDVIKRQVEVDQSDYESVAKAAIAAANDMVGGSQENLKLNQDTVAWYHKKQFLNTYHKSPMRLRAMQVIMRGNHFDNANRDSAIGENDKFEHWVKELGELHKDFPNMGIEPFSVALSLGGVPRHYQKNPEDHEVVVYSFGYSTSRQGTVPDYGIGHDGKLLTQRTYRIGLSHEPKNAANKLRNQRVHVLKTGHTHDASLGIDKSGHNDGSFLDQIGTTQRVTATELGYAGLPRTAGVGIKVYTQPGRYFKLFIPAEHMRKIGLAWLKLESEKAIAEAGKAPVQKRKTSKKSKKKRKK